jgi:F-box/TPR repeat protein Pof3
LSPKEGADLSLVEWPLLETFICGRNFEQGTELLASLISAAIAARTLKHIQVYYQLDVLVLFPKTDSPIPSIEVLRITDCDKPEDILLEFLRRCISLRRLTLERTKITGVGVKELMTRASGPLEYLGLLDCIGVSVDAVEWARSMGTTVDYRFAGDWGKRSFREISSSIY